MNQKLKYELQSYQTYHENYNDFLKKIPTISEVAGNKLVNFCAKNKIDLTLPSSLSNVSPDNKYAFIAQYVFATKKSFIGGIFEFNDSISEVHISVELGEYPPPKNLILKPGQKYMDLIIFGQFVVS